MDKKEFERLVQRVKIKNPLIFVLDSDCKPAIEEIMLIEKQYDMAFPKSYKDFFYNMEVDILDS